MKIYFSYDLRFITLKEKGYISISIKSVLIYALYFVIGVGFGMYMGFGPLREIGAIFVFASVIVFTINIFKNGKTN